MNNKPSGKFRLDGLFRQNIVLMSGLVTAPIIVAATTFERALVHPELPSYLVLVNNHLSVHSPGDSLHRADNLLRRSCRCDVYSNRAADERAVP